MSTAHTHGIGDPASHDERDDDVRRLDPNPKAFAPLNPVDVSKSSHTFSAAVAGRVAVSVTNRALSSEAVPGCAVRIGTATGTTTAAGTVSIDVSGLADGEHALSVLAPDVSTATVGPGFPADPSKERVWRPFAGTATVANHRIVDASPAPFARMAAGQLAVRLQPAWMRTRMPAAARPAAPTMLVIHHTAGALEGDVRHLLYSGVASVHYLVAPNGEVYKMVADDRVAAHAGSSFWKGIEGTNSRSIGIEITHDTGVEYPAVQADAVVDLVKRISAAFPSIPAHGVVGHSDVGITKPEHRPPTKLGRKSTDPGSAFPWERIEALGLSFQYAAGTLKPTHYGGFFKIVPAGRLIVGDNDAARRYGGQVRPDVQGAIRELQTDLTRIGYFCPVDGDYGSITAMTVQMFQEHVFSGTRRRGTDPWNSGDGRLDLATAEYVKRVLGDSTADDIA